MSSQPPAMAEPTYRLPCYRRFAYGIGHVLNDLCASMWFSYLLVYYHSVLQFSNQNAGFLLLVGQVADAIATPLVGYESDRIQGFCRYTKRKSWHLLGTICVIASFPFLFMPNFGGQNSAEWARFIYYAPFVVIFQFGWASTQISHLSLIPELTPNSSERVELNAIRYAFTVCSNVAVYLIAWLLLNSAVGTDIGRSDAGTFRTLVISVVSGGAVFALIFHIFTQEWREEDLPRGLLSRLSSSEKMNWIDWLKEPQFYMIAILYMCTRLIVNVSQIYLPMFLTDSLKLHKQYIATVPLAVFVSGFLVSFIMRPLNHLVGRKLTYLLGILMVLGAVTWMFFLQNVTNKEVFGAAVLLGAGSSTILVTSLSMTADLIGDRTESGAFVYGAMSFTDKLSNGIAVVIIQHLHPCKTEACCSACVWFYRDMIVFVPGGVAIIALVCLIIIAPQHLGTLRKSVGNQFRRESECLEGAPLFGDSKTTDGGMTCCSYLCCVSLSRDAQDHKVALCSTCGMKDCRQHGLLVNAQTNYSSFSDSDMLTQASLRHGNGRSGQDSGGDQTPTGGTPPAPVVLRTCAAGRPITGNDDVPASPPGVECQMRTCAAGRPITVNADVHT